MFLIIAETFKNVYNKAMKETFSAGRPSLLSIIIASVCICLYLTALISASVRIYTHADRQRDIALDEFGYIADLASSAGVLGFMDEPFIETIEKALRASRTLEGLIITGPYGAYPFEKYPGQAINTVNNLPQFKNRFDFSRQLLYMPLRIQNLRNVNIEARASAVDYGQVTGILKQSLFIVLASLLLAFFTLVIQSLMEFSNRKRNNEESYNDGKTGFDSEPIPRQPDIQTRQPEKEQPKGLYSPRGKIGWEEYTTVRLDSELQRCAGNEQDLVYMAMEFKDVHIMDDTFYSNFADDTVAFFTMRDLIFEKGERGITIILPNTELDAAITKANAYHDRCVEKYSGLLKAKNDLCMGLSSRSGRLINATRLMFEGNKALEKALADPVSNIIAFKSDPEKYRNYIASRHS
jgi:hypothetical protein